MKDSDYIYRKVEALYHSGKSTDEIARECRISKFQALTIIQDIFGRQMMKKERRA